MYADHACVVKTPLLSTFGIGIQAMMCKRENKRICLKHELIFLFVLFYFRSILYLRKYIHMSLVDQEDHLQKDVDICRSEN